MDRRELAALAGALAEVMSRDAAREFFNEPVDAVALGIPDYLDIVERPMCLGEIADRVRRQLDDAERCERAGDAARVPPRNPILFPSNGRRSDDSRRALPLLVAALEDVRLVWRNYRSYNAHPPWRSPRSAASSPRPPRRPGAF